LLERLRKRQLQLAAPELDFINEFKTRMKEDMLPTIEKSSATMADHVVSGFERMTSAMNAFTMNNGWKMMERTAKSVAAAMTDALRSIAADKVREHIAEAAGQMAKGFGLLALKDIKGAGAAFKSAGLHTLAAAKWGLLGGAEATAARPAEPPPQATKHKVRSSICSSTVSIQRTLVIRHSLGRRSANTKSGMAYRLTLRHTEEADNVRGPTNRLRRRCRCRDLELHVPVQAAWLRVHGHRGPRRFGLWRP
jgi:hypothetical protein